MIDEPGDRPTRPTAGYGGGPVDPRDQPTIRSAAKPADPFNPSTALFDPAADPFNPSRDPFRQQSRPDGPYGPHGLDGADEPFKLDEYGPEDPYGLQASGPAAAPARRSGGLAALFAALILGGLVSLSLGIFGRIHTPTGIAVNVAGFSSPLTVKVWLATGAVVFGVIQVLSAIGLYGKVPKPFAGLVPSWIGGLHRWSGRIAFLLAVPVAVHCLYALGFADYDLRTLLHSLFGCMFFGVFAAKMLLLTRSGLAGWVLPIFGSTLFAVLTGVWATSALWFFTTSGFKL
jgi:hypothetical protein